MSTAVLDRFLAVLLLAVAATGLISLQMGAPRDGWLFVLHGSLAGSLAFAAAWKVARSMPNAIQAGRWGRVALGSIVSIATTAALVGGFAWVASGRLLSIGSWTVMTMHAWIGLALLPVVAVHLLPRRWRLLVPRTTAVRSRTEPGVARRRVLVAGALGVAGLSTYALAGIMDRLLGGVRRLTGSRWLPSGGVPPATTFYGEGAPRIDPAAWQLRVSGRVWRTVAVSLHELRALGERDLRAILDCTSGWAMDTTWRGVPLASLLEMAGVDSGARSIIVRSATGFATALSRADAERSLLAIGVAGAPLPAANGAPCRLVVPDHRGLDWVKWVSDIEIV